MALSGVDWLHSATSKYSATNARTRRSASSCEDETQIGSWATLVSESGSRPASAACSRILAQAERKLCAV
jgi:hypothetical protein